MTAPDNVNTQEQLAWEARQRPRAAMAAALAALLVFAGQVVRGLALQDAPRAEFLDALLGVQAAGPISDRESLQIATAEFLNDHTLGVVLPAVAEGLGYFAFAYALTFLAAATRARRRELIKLALYLPAVGGVLMGVATIARAVGRVADVDAFLEGPRTVESAQDIGLGGVSLVAEVMTLPAVLALAAALFLVSLNAMRAGLLTRFMGILGAIVGALQVVQFGPLPLVQTFWLIGLALLFTGRRQGGELPAWQTGREEPWPSQREVAEARAQAAAERTGEPDFADAPVAPGSSNDKRKRKRRG